MLLAVTITLKFISNIHVDHSHKLCLCKGFVMSGRLKTSLKDMEKSHGTKSPQYNK